MKELRYPPAEMFGSAAIGLYYGEGITFHKSEIENIDEIKSNSQGNYLHFHISDNRQNLIQYLPGPAILLSLLWKVIPNYNFSPYIYLQIILDSILIFCFFLFFRRKDKKIFFTTSVLMAINPIIINKTVLIMGYDFWPSFCVLINFIGIALVLRNFNRYRVLFITGLLSALTVWFRSTTTFLPFFMMIPIIIYMKSRNSLSINRIIKIVSCYLLPVIISILLLSVLRYDQTGSFRPTRSTFWHSFIAGVAQFSNPYGIKPIDNEIRNFGKRLDVKLKDLSYSELHSSSNSLYEITLKKQSIDYIIHFPHFFLRNIFYRAGIMLSPALYRNWGTVPPFISSILFPIGVILLPIWSFGMFYLFSTDRILFLISSTIYAYHICMFSWFFIVARIIFPFLFINILIYLFGVIYLIKLLMGLNYRKPQIVNKLLRQYIFMN